MSAQGQAIERQPPGLAPPIVHEVLRGGGEPLDAPSRTALEARFGHDFGRVRIHDDARAARSAQAVSARAYTVGRDIVFAANQYAPHTDAGRRLLAHELVHVVQQGDWSGTVPMRLHVGRPGDSWEVEAEAAASRLSRRDAVPSGRVVGRSTIRLQRQPLACFETSVEQFRRAPVCTPPSRVVQPGQRPERVCGVYPGGSTDCEVDEATGNLTGKIKRVVEETDRCVRPCVDLHERVHERQLLALNLCSALQGCWEAAERGQRPATDCWKMALRGPELECEAYQASVICLEERLATAPECADPVRFHYAQDVLEGEKCYLQYNCSQVKAPATGSGPGPGRRPATGGSRPR